MGSAAGALASFTVAGCRGAAGAATTAPPSGASRPRVTPRPTGSTLPVAAPVAFVPAAAPLVMQVLAHPDDDLYFMNPDTLSTLERGVPVVSVYVTSGDSFGVNRAPGQRHRPKGDIPAYVSARQQGLRQAYARMLGATIFTPWVRTALDLPGGGAAEVATLVHDGRRAELVFLRIDMHTPVSGGTLGIDKLWAKGGEVNTVPQPDSPVRGTHTFDPVSLTDALAFLMDRYRPSLIRTLDPDPDIQVHDASHPRGSDQGGYSDHRDHTAVAQFTWRAMAQWSDRTAAGGTAPSFLTETYRGYYNQRWAHSLPQDVVRMKAGLLDVYGGNPAWACGNPGGCGDYSVGQGASLRDPRGWVRSTHYRYPTAGPRAGRAKDGRLVAYGVLGTRAVRWTVADAPGAAWSAPEDLGGGPLVPALGVATGADGHDLVFALRFSGLDGDPGADTREIVMLETSGAGGARSAWRRLGNPEQDPVRGRRVGPPAVVAGRDGRIHLFVRNASKGLSTRVREAEGHWSPWRALSGGQVQEGLAAALDAQGLIHVFAAGFTAVHEWAQDTPGGELRHRQLKGMAPPAEAPDAVAAADGSLLLAYREPDTAVLVVERLAEAAGGHHWTPAAQLGGAGFGPVSLLAGQPVRAGEEPVLAVRGVSGDAHLVRDGLVVAPGGVPAAVHNGAGSFAVGRPALLKAGAGGPLLVSLGLDAAPDATPAGPGGS
ncbi:PIG-L family deacetylase [Streptomyces cocklensis]|jgi:LmbE family N-acetylglucosaminyl deacetylase|uniref:GlcNAc-PI de-N-acetylase n=1 Tax=Actinacidiphila cocklensis TaxID=887465 RepID=A0A9W4GQ51_9ACTN|nr:PIG-L family deacetylase [Actinacidiphila cocklensis]MDD1058125.1 PIG-L family deacetylase [Actinacidiphila cocklensis]CAG6393165.1 GlcNAc-PI de-N-acetylase [Actinacidiphila cocklensis]